MNKKILNYIDWHLNNSASEHMGQLVYIIAKLSLISTPAAWIVKLPREARDKLFLSHADASSYIDLNGRPDDYIAPLYTTVNVDVASSGIKRN
ncbi:hypothetical protein PMI39_023350 [Pantoea sp. YR343]|jgi:hypothetical protein|uniref:hypothetical protein n=1 Tax=Pantoea sp. YR343 TaxID=1144341 RepID=UPI000270E0E2|nr:hypothetical protein [Pantoea sp. YR343]KAJ9430501.1 hypothetical protein PMI39_023350 [Pantoea sp. YR343]